MRRILTYLDPLLECKVALVIFCFKGLVSENNFRGKLGDHCTHGTAKAVAVRENGGNGRKFSHVSWKQLIG